MMLFSGEKNAMKQDESKADPISQAIRASDLPRLRELIQSSKVDWRRDRAYGKVDPGLQQPSTYLTEAVAFGKLPELIYISQLVTTQMARSRDFWQRSPLLWAVAYNQKSAFIVLIAMGFDLHEVSEQQLDAIPQDMQENSHLLETIKIFYRQRAISSAYDTGLSFQSPIGVGFSRAIKQWSKICFDSLTHFSTADLQEMSETLEPLFTNIEDDLKLFFQLFLQGIAIRCQQSGDDFADIELYQKICQHAHFAKGADKPLLEAFRLAQNSLSLSAAPASTMGNQ